MAIEQHETEEGRIEYKRETPPCPPEEYGRHVIADIHTRKPVAFVCPHCFEVFDWKKYDIFSHTLRCPVLQQQEVRQNAERTIATHRQYLRKAARIRRMLKALGGRQSKVETQRLLDHWREYNQRDDLTEDQLEVCLLMMWAFERKVAGLPACPTDAELLADEHD